MANIDAHFHCWQLARGDYGWLTPALAPIYR
ncbi:MAG: amidohydrolase, partial [Polaromonas sp.]|nr:amidohydrolase [Polaromonas sp.]